MKKQDHPSGTKVEATTLVSLAGDVQMKRVNFQLPANQHTRLKVYAAQHGTTITELLTEHVKQLIGE